MGPDRAVRNYPDGIARPVAGRSNSSRYAWRLPELAPLNRGTAGRACEKTTGESIGSGADSHGCWPYGVEADVYCEGTGQTWAANVWDDNGATVGC